MYNIFLVLLGLFFPIHNLQIGDAGKMFLIVSHNYQTIIHGRTTNQQVKGINLCTLTF